MQKMYIIKVPIFPQYAYHYRIWFYYEVQFEQRFGTIYYSLKNCFCFCSKYMQRKSFTHFTHYDHDYLQTNMFLKGPLKGLETWVLLTCVLQLACTSWPLMQAFQHNVTSTENLGQRGLNVNVQYFYSRCLIISMLIFVHAYINNRHMYDVLCT